MKFIVPTTSIQKTGSLEDFYYDLLVGRDDLNKIQNGSNTEVTGNLELTLGQINQILAEGGEVYEYLVAVKADIGILGDDLSDGLPNRAMLDENAASEVRKFKHWFENTAEVWKKDTDDQIYFLSNPFGTSVSKYLKGSEIALIYTDFVSTRNADIDTIAQFNAVVGGGGWTQVIF